MFFLCPSTDHSPTVIFCLEMYGFLSSPLLLIDYSFDNGSPLLSFSSFVIFFLLFNSGGGLSKYRALETLRNRPFFLAVTF